MIKTFLIAKTTDKETFEITVKHFLMEYFHEVAEVPYVITPAFHLEERYDEIREFIGDQDIKVQYEKVKAELMAAVLANEDDNTILLYAYQLEDILFREYHPGYPIYDLSNQGFCFPKDPEGWLGVEVTVDYPINIKEQTSINNIYKP